VTCILAGGPFSVWDLGGGEELAQSAAAMANHLRRLRPKKPAKKKFIASRQDSQAANLFQ
jgi:hypothetical protein